LTRDSGAADQKVLPTPDPMPLTEVQQAALGKLLAHDTGVFVAPPGIGKTVVGTALVAARKCSTLVLVHRMPLLDQWRARLALFLGLDPREVGQIGGGKQKANGLLDVAMLQTLVRAEGVDGRVAEYGQVIVDECHHLPAFSFERVLAEAKARYVVGLTATPRRRDGHHPITTMQLGPVRFKVSAKEQAARRPFEHKLIVRETEFVLPDSQQDLRPAQIYDFLINDDRRNSRILDDVIASIREGRSPIVLTERREHATLLASHLECHAPKLVVLVGGRSVRERRAAAARLAALAPDEPRVIVATGKFVGKGFDDARLDTLFLTMPISWDGLLVQYVGPLHRLHPAKREVRVFDYVDGAVPVLRRMFDKRLKGYRAAGYEMGELPDGFELLAEPEYHEGGWDVDLETTEDRDAE
jgi:superfamily II DNA or RNA helicase